ncbi:histidinol-phosphatase HisJ family protein [Brassicibacter mesophilus]|uniref:histidinol-phosphatase HisJ family protein n=1 Tax=Brassicibacter mesophilus TaxID=745119 RepID=UPI003D229E2B
MYDYHVHSNFSGDCKYSMEEMVLGAIEKNVKVLSFTDHIDFDYGNSEIDFVFDVNDYFKEFKKIKHKYRGQIEILSGIELGMQPHLSKTINRLICLDLFDFIIMSIHTAKGKELHEGEFYINKAPQDAYKDYYGDLYSCLSSFNDFDVIGHLNLIDRYVKYMDKGLELGEYKPLLTKVLEKLIAKEKGIEINTSGIRYGVNSFHPTVEILKLYKDLGGEILSIGSDAHKPEDICFAYNDVINLLRELGFKYITNYKNRKKHFIKIE